MQKERVNGRVIIQISIIWIFIVAIIATFAIAFFHNRIFATNGSKDEKLADVEPNENTVDILQIMVENNYTNKKIVNEEREIEFKTEETEDSQLPKGERKVIQKGKKGKLQVKALQQFENNAFISEEILESSTSKMPTNEIVHIGTSEFLEKYKVHIGEEMYLTETTELKKEAKYLQVEK